MSLRLQTPVELRPAPGLLSCKDRILVLGSCFADETGRRLREDGFQAVVFNVAGEDAFSVNTT